MSIREVINMLTALFNFFVELFSEYFGGAKEETEEVVPEA